MKYLLSLFFVFSLQATSTITMDSNDFNFLLERAGLPIDKSLAENVTISSADLRDIINRGGSKLPLPLGNTTPSPFGKKICYTTCSKRCVNFED